jgi:hypothetical protein
MAKTITIKAETFDTAGEAVQHYYASGRGEVVSLRDGRYLVAERAEIDRLEAAGVPFAYLYDHEYPPGSGECRLVSVPVNN